MTQLRRLVAISILVVSLFGAALADGGATQTPPVAPPAPVDCTTDCTTTPTTAPAQSSSVDIASMTDTLVTLLAQSIL